MSLQISRSRAMSQGAQRPKYPQGDPGLLGGILGGIGGFLTGGPAGAIAGAVGGWKGGGRSTPAPQLAAPRGLPPINLPGFGPRGVGIGGQSSRTRIGAFEPSSNGSGQAIPSGYRLNKSSYFLKDGTFVPKGTKLVKVRRRNSLNMKALNRAISRVNGANGVQSKLSEISTGKYTATGKKKSCS